MKRVSQILCLKGCCLFREITAGVDQQEEEGNESMYAKGKALLGELVVSLIELAPQRKELSRVPSIQRHYRVSILKRDNFIREKSLDSQAKIPAAKKSVNTELSPAQFLVSCSVIFHSLLKVFVFNFCRPVGRRTSTWTRVAAPALREKRRTTMKAQNAP